MPERLTQIAGGATCATRSSNRLTLVAWCLALFAATNSAHAADCPNLDSDPRTALNTALNYFKTATKSQDTKFEAFVCAYELAKELLEHRFNSFFLIEPDLTLRLVREAADLQRVGQDSSRGTSDTKAEASYYGFERQLRTKAIGVLSAQGKKLPGELRIHYSELVAVTAIHKDARGVIDVVGSLQEPSWLESEPRFVYLKAVASCPAFDMTSAETMDFTGLATRLKDSRCDEAADDALAMLCPKPGQSIQPRLAGLLAKFRKAGKKCE